MNATGVNTATRENVAAIAAKAISCVPVLAASVLVSPSSLFLYMLSITIMASSMTSPIARVSPSMVMVLRVKPMKYRNTKAPVIATGMVIPVMSVAERFLRNRNTTTIASTPPTRSANSISSILSFMNVEASNATSAFMPAGSSGCISASLSLTSLASSTVLAPGFFLIPSPTAGTPLYLARLRLSSSPSSAYPTSLSLMG